jgi:hypothetical protein
MNNLFFTVEQHETAALAAVHLLQLPPVWLLAPFILLLLIIATGPLFYHRIRERHYAKICIGLGGVEVV